LSDQSVTLPVENLNTIGTSSTKYYGTYDTSRDFHCATPKYVRNKGPRGDNYAETAARLFLSFPNETRKSQFIRNNSQTAFDAQLAKSIADVSGTTGFIDFSLTALAFASNEKVQVVDTMSGNFVAYFYDSSPEQLQMTGVVSDTYEADQLVWLHTLYKKYFRGTAVAKRGIYVHLLVNNWLFIGGMTSLNVSLSADNQTAASFNMTMLLTKTEYKGPKLSYPAGVSTIVSNNISTDSSKLGLSSQRQTKTGEEDTGGINEEVFASEVNGVDSGVVLEDVITWSRNQQNPEDLIEWSNPDL
jgi:hypothetical protein